MVLKTIKLPEDRRVLVGPKTSDDAGVFLLDDGRAVAATVDFFTPIVDDPYLFGQITAANSLSDIYAMGGTPLFALSIAGFPSKKYKPEILSKVIQGAINKCNEAPCPIIGGHTLEDDEMKFGLAVIGDISPDKIIMNSTARAGDRIILTKPIGIGIISTALKAGEAEKETVDRMTEVMLKLNKEPSKLMVEEGASSCTDITGFGLIAHAQEMARASMVGIRLYAGRVPHFSEAVEFAKMGLLPGGLYKNAEFCAPFEHISDDVPKETIDLLHSPETSGGLLISIAEDRAEKLLGRIRANGFPEAEIIGEVLEVPRGVIEVVS